MPLLSSAHRSNLCYLCGTLVGLLCSAIAAFLYFGERTAAKRCTLLASAVSLVGWGILTPATSALGSYSPGFGAVGFGIAMILTGLVFFPPMSFYLMFYGMSAAFALCAILLFAHYVRSRGGVGVAWGWRGVAWRGVGWSGVEWCGVAVGWCC